MRKALALQASLPVAQASFNARRVNRFNEMLVLDPDWDHMDCVEPDEMIGDHAHDLDDERLVREAGHAW